MTALTSEGHLQQCTLGWMSALRIC